ncbi:MAG: hypothetical protein Q4B07_05615 [Clostridia bacterium]|nr:hypothetical protein [Clostridia bacterium]
MEHRTETGKGSEKTKLLCPQCGGNMEVETQEGTQLLSCPFCGYSEVYEKELTMDEKIVMAHRLAHARESARLRAQEEYESRQKKSVRTKTVWKQSSLPAWARTLIILGVILSVIGGIVLFSRWDPTKKTVDPFQYVEVTFSGTDGEGKAEIKPLPIDEEGNDIRYSLSSHGWLSEGDSIILKASDGSYNLKSRKKTYIVTGLDPYVTDAAQLDEAAQAYLHELSENAIDQGYGRGVNYSLLGVFTKQYDTYTYRPCGIVLLSDGQRGNYILNVYEITFANPENAETIYIVYELTGVVLRKNSAAPLSFENGYFSGDLIDLGSWDEGYLGSVYGFTTEEDIDLYVRKVAANHNYTVIQKIPAGE